MSGPQGTYGLATNARANGLYGRVSLLRWILPVAIFISVVSYETAKHGLGVAHPAEDESFGLYYVVDVIFFGGLGPIVVFLALTWIVQRVVEREQAEQRLADVYRDLTRYTEQLGLLNEISQSLASKVDLEGILDLVVRIPEQLVDAKGASVFLLDETTGKLSQAKSHGISEDFVSTTFADDDVNCSRTPPGLGEGPPHLSLLLGRGSQVIGALNVHLSPDHYPSETEMKLLGTITNTSAAAIEGARLRARDLLTLYEVDRSIRAEPNLDRLLNEILSKVILVCGADCGAVLLYDEGNAEFSVQAAARANGRACDDCPEVGWGKANWTREVNGPLLLPDLREGSPCRCSGRRPRGIKSLMCIPMVAGDRVVGVIALGHHLPGVFSKSQLSLLSAIASQAALVVRNAQLYVRSEEQAIAEERSRIAREVHDGVAQDLAFLMLKADLCLDLSGDDQEELRDELKAIRRGLFQNVQEIRRAILALRPIWLEREGLMPALRKFVQDFEEQTRLQVELSLLGRPKQLSSELESALFRLVQESLNNVGKHANAKRVGISLDFRPIGTVDVVIEDDGRGFDPAAVAAGARTSGGLGLLQMKERLEAVGGNLTIATRLGEGVRVEAVLPLDG